MVEAVRSLPGEAVVKPENTYCGIGIEFFKPGVSEEQLEAYWDKWKPHVIVQPYLEAIEESGDLRILTINDTITIDSLKNCRINCGRPAPSTLRIPTSRARLVARAVARFIKLIQAISRMKNAIIDKM